MSAIKSRACSTLAVAAFVSVLLGVPTTGSAATSPSAGSAPVPIAALQGKDAEQLRYIVRYLDQTGKEVFRTTANATRGERVAVVAEDLFDKGYELFDVANKPIEVTANDQEVVFVVGKSRELMSLTEFLRHPVNYDYPIKFRNLDFRGRQDDLEAFVIKNIYQTNKSTGVFYGTKEQAHEIRKTLLNGSFHGGYARYVTNFVPSIPKHIEGDKYELSIDFTYQEHPEDIRLGEEKISRFIDKYGTDYTDAEKVKLIHDWLMKNGTLYEPKHGGQEWFYNTIGTRRVHFPASLMLDGEGVCLTYAMTFSRLAERMGLETRMIQGYTGLNNEKDAVAAQKMFDNPDSTTYTPRYLNHTWNLVKVDRAWHHVDTFQDMVLRKFSREPESHMYHQFLRDDDFIRHNKITMTYRNRDRQYQVYRAWNKHDIPDAPTAKHEFWVMRDRAHKDLNDL